MTRFEKLEGYPDEIRGRFNSFITTQFDDSLSVEMQIRSLIKWISSSRELINDIVDYINLFIELFDERLQEEIVGRLNEWLADGTLAQIINEDVFDMKADKTFVDSEIERLVTQLEQIPTMVNVQTFSGSDVDKIKQGSQSNTELFFPSGVYYIDEHFTIENIENLTWRAIGDVILYDTCKNIVLNDGTGGLGANGILFKNSNIRFEGNFIHDNAVEKTHSVAYSESDAVNAKPFIDFQHTNVSNFNVKIKGLAQPYVVNTSTVFDHMKIFYVRFYGSESVEIKGSEILTGAGGGEFYGLNKVDNVSFQHVKYIKKDARYSPWSIGKIIDCENIVVDNLQTQTSSSGSLMDISGTNIVYKNHFVDAPEGKFLDVTQEWGTGNIYSGNYTIKDSHINTATLAFNSTTGDTDIKYVEQVIIDNVYFDKKIDRSPRIYLPFTKNIVIKNQTILNRDSLCDIYVNPQHEYVVDEMGYQNILIENVHVENTKDVDLTLVEAKGQTILKDSKVNLNNHSPLEFRHRNDDLLGTGKLDKNISFVVENTHFKNGELIINGNTKFVNCSFENIAFSLNRRSSIFDVSFLNCEFNLDTQFQPLAQTSFINVDGRLDHLTFDGCLMNGEYINTAGSPILYIREGGRINHLNVRNTTSDVARLDSSGLPTGSVTMFISYEDVFNGTQVNISNAENVQGGIYFLPALSKNGKINIVNSRSTNHLLRSQQGSGLENVQVTLFNSNLGVDNVFDEDGLRTRLVDNGADVVMSGNYRM